MIKKINQLTNLGQFEKFNSNQVLSVNNIIFGFNGAGKSTLSDMFYSLAHENNEKLITRRRTLNRIGEEGNKDIDIEILGDDGNIYRFKNEMWDARPDNMYVFNSQYIKEHVFVSRHIEGNSVHIMLGREGAKYMSQREDYINKNVELMDDINKNIKILMDNNLKIKDFSSGKLTVKTSDKRYKSMSEIALYPIGDKAKIEERLKNNEKYNNEISVLEKCTELCEKINTVEVVSLSNVKTHIVRVPKVTSKEIAGYLKKTITSTDIKWAVRGYLLQKDKNICPMCGQEVSDRQAQQFFTKLGKYICQNKDEKVKQLSNELQQLAYDLETIAIDQKIVIFKEIITNLTDNKLLLKKEEKRFDKGLSWDDHDTEILLNLIKRIKQKAENPFIEIEFSEEENNTILLMNSVIKSIKAINVVLKDVRERVDKKNEKRFSIDDMGRFFELSYGIYRANAEEIKAKSAQVLKNKEKIVQLNEKINDCYNQNRLNSVNSFLMQLNTHIKIEVRHNNYFIRLKDFQEKLYEHDGETLLSEGEKNAVAFAYFLMEIENMEVPEKIIVIDDPISSMDLSRKSIISHKISEMMTNKLYQIIVMSHDISFVERVVSYLSQREVDSMILMELRAEKEDFLPLCIEEYLTDDKKVYEKFICQAQESDSEIDKVIAFMSMRPYAYVKNVSELDYKRIETQSTYFAHTRYSHNSRIQFIQSDYDRLHLKEYINLINEKTNSVFDAIRIVGDYDFNGFDFDKITNLYMSLPIDSMDNLRKKVLMMRPLIEACFFQLSSKDKFDPEHIGKMYKNVTNSNASDPLKKAMCVSLKELYDSSKKYHHGADEGSMLGVSWINPSEVEYFDKVISEIVAKIRNNSLVRTLSA